MARAPQSGRRLRASACPSRLQNGRYQVTGRLGDGGMGIVYEARDHQNGTTVAVKALRSSNADDLARFENEFRALRDLHHPNFVELGEMFEEDGRPYFTMERVEGTDFRTAITGIPFDTDTHTEPLGEAETEPAPGWAESSRPTLPSPERPLDRERLVDSLVQLTQALQALHAQGLVHRDIKPSNVLVTPEGRVVLIDFGLVTTVSSAEWAAAGTPAYMAPEQGAGAPAGPAADWYALGVMLYEVLTHRLPFEGTSKEMLSRKQCGDPVSPSTWVEVDADLEALCMALLARDPSRRADGHTVLATLAPELAAAAPVSPSCDLDDEFPTRLFEETFDGETDALSTVSMCA